MEDLQPVDLFLPTVVISINSLHLMIQVHLQLSLFARLLQSPDNIIG